MDQSTSNIDTSPVSGSNIVATAMSSANLSPSPVPTVCISISEEGSSVDSLHTKMTCRSSPSPPSSLQTSEPMEVIEISDRSHNQMSDDRARTESMLLDQEKIVLISDNNTMKEHQMEGSPIQVHSPDGSTDHHQIRSLVMLSDSDVSIDKNGHLMPPSPSHTPQSASQISEGDQAVRALLVYNERGEQTMDSFQVNPKKEKDDSPLMKEDSYPITCGTSKGDLVWRKFICPGINAKCVRCANQWMTPKEFVQAAGKSTLKDWKRAIRINGTMLRKMIESGEVDYFQHEANCSNQCRSNKGASLEATSSRDSFNHSFDIADSREQSASEPCLERSNSEDNTMLSARRNTIMNISRLSQDSLKSGMSSLERSSSEDSGLASSPQLDGMVMRESIATADKVQDLQAFWSGIVRTDLFDEVVQDVVTQVTAIQHRAKTLQVVSPEDAVMMTNLANALELIPTIAQKMACHKMTVERQSEQTNHVIQELERKLAEQRKYDQDLKRKSQHLESVISLTPNEKRKRKAMVRLYRQKAVDGRHPSGLQQSGPGGSSVSSRLTSSEMVTVVPSNQLIRYPGHELWVPQASTAVAHALQQVASNQMARMNVSGQMISMPIPPHMLSSHDPNNYTIHQQDSSKK